MCYLSNQKWTTEKKRAFWPNTSLSGEAPCSFVSFLFDPERIFHSEKKVKSGEKAKQVNEIPQFK